jgi:alkanesulfonate monooxygenase SsuD/methylene tetrahydromethanopterin reductase-like flavin-dependent oxidoreductase (luciferase family)
VGQLGGRCLCARQGKRHLFDPDKLHALHHHGAHFQVRGPLNVARSPQGRPVVVQAGASTRGASWPRARPKSSLWRIRRWRKPRLSTSIKSRVQHYGRHPDDVKIMPGIFPVVGRTQAEAEASSSSCSR